METSLGLFFLKLIVNNFALRVDVLLYGLVLRSRYHQRKRQRLQIQTLLMLPFSEFFFHNTTKLLNVFTISNIYEK